VKEMSIEGWIIFMCMWLTIFAIIISVSEEEDEEEDNE
jgi:hypothetical protein